MQLKPRSETSKSLGGGHGQDLDNKEPCFHSSPMIDFYKQSLFAKRVKGKFSGAPQATSVLKHFIFFQCQFTLSYALEPMALAGTADRITVRGKAYSSRYCKLNIAVLI